MKVIDKILLEWSYKCHDGVVDLDNHDKVMILREILDEESNNNLDMFFEANMSPSAEEAVQYIKDKYGFDDSNFKFSSKSTFGILTRIIAEFNIGAVPSFVVISQLIIYGGIL